MLHLHNLHKTYQGAAPLHVLQGITLDIAPGEFVSIMGASGSGKSTLLNILGILDNYDEGEYILDGQPIKNLSENRAADLRNRMIGFIFQNFNLIPYKNALENVALPLYYQGVGRKKRNALALEHLEHIPTPGERFICGRLELTVTQIEEKRIRQLHATVLPPPPEETEKEPRTLMDVLAPKTAKEDDQ